MSQFNETFEIEGYWWFPENPNKTVPGTLHYSPEDIQLDLIGALTDLTQHQKQFEYKIILGFSTKGQPITLYQCFATKFSMSDPRLPTSSYEILNCFIGTYFQKEEDIKFKQINAHLTHFDEWMGISGFSTNIDSLQEGNVNLSYSQPNEIRFSVNGIFTISIWFGFSMNVNHADEKEQGIKQRISLNIESKTDLPFNQFRDTLMDIRRFLGLACLNPIYPIEVTGSTASSDQEVKDQTARRTITMYFQQSQMPTKIKYVHSMHMLFTYRDISENIEKYFKKWFENKSILEPIYDLYFEVLYNKHLPLDIEFLLLAHAVESYHRRTSTETEVDPKEFEAKIKNILDSVHAQYRDWLREELRYSNELSLRKRLQFLLKQFSFVLDDKTMAENQFVQYVIDGRNYLTHYSNQTQNPLHDIHKLHDVCERLKLVVEACFLFQLGFDIAKIQTLINKSKEIKGLIKQGS